MANSDSPSSLVGVPADDFESIHDDMCALMQRIARLQEQPTNRAGMPGFLRAEHLLGILESKILMARARRATFDPAAILAAHHDTEGDNGSN